MTIQNPTVTEKERGSRFCHPGLRAGIQKTLTTRGAGFRVKPGMTLVALASIIFIAYSLVPHLPSVYAQNDGPLLLSPLPGTFNDDTQKPRTTLKTYLPGMFKLAIGFSALLAVVMIIIGGAEYMFSTSSGGTGKARTRIVGAVWGLIMVLAAWLILNTINPKLVAFDLNITPAKVTSTNTQQTAELPLCTSIGDTKVPDYLGKLCGSQTSKCTIKSSCPNGEQTFSDFRSCAIATGRCRQ